MATKYTTVIVSAKSHEDHDDCLTAASSAYAGDHGLESWQVTAAWADDSREQITLTVPASAVDEAVSAAIARSVSHNEIAHLEYSEELDDALSELADGDAQNGTEHEFWGTSDDGDEWRVHLSNEVSNEIGVTS